MRVLNVYTADVDMDEAHWRGVPVTLQEVEVVAVSGYVPGMRKVF